MRQFIRTDQGSGWVNRFEAMGKGRILIALVPVHLRCEGKTTVLPAGTVFMRNRDLERRTFKKPREERRTHMIIEEGLHHLERLCHHVRSNERADYVRMAERHEDIAQVAKDLFECGQLTFEIHERLQATISVIRKDFDEMKKNENKVTVRKRLDTTNAQRTRAGRFKPAPAALTAYASTAHVRKRLDEVSGIHAAFSADAIETRVKLDEVKQLTGAVWVDVQVGSPVLELVDKALDHLTRSRVLVNIAVGNVATFATNLKAITAMPYVPLARLALRAVDDLRRNIKLGRVKQANEATECLRYLLRRMRMLWYVERSLIHILSFLPDDGDVPAALMNTFRKRLGDAEERVKNMQSAEFDPELRLLVQEYFDATRTNLADGSYDRAHDELKRLTKDLRVQPVHPAPRRKAAA